METNHSDYMYCIGACKPICDHCKRHYPIGKPCTGEQTNWTAIQYNKDTHQCPMLDAEPGKWISTDIALPALKERVLIAYDGADTKRIRISKLIERAPNGAWRWSNQAYERITHWQPLPPKPSENE